MVKVVKKRNRKNKIGGIIFRLINQTFKNGCNNLLMNKVMGKTNKTTMTNVRAIWVIILPIRIKLL